MHPPLPLSKMSTKLQHMQNLLQIFQKSVESVRPASLLNETKNFNLKPQLVDGRRLVINIQGKTLDITRKRCHVVGFGKAVLGMAVQLENALDKRLLQGILSVPFGTQNQFQHHDDMQLQSNSRITVFEGAPNNQPDEKAMETAKRIKQLATEMTENDILFVLISGGGSALLPLPKATLKLTEKMQLIRKLANCGASIDEMNLVRISLSDIKGGRLAVAAKNAFAVISFVISDIVNDPVDLIASGPTCGTVAKKLTAKEVLEKYEMWQTLPAHIQQIIMEAQSAADIQPGANNSIYVIGDNRVATATAIAQALEFGYNPFIASTTIQGDVQHLQQLYMQLLRHIRQFQQGELNEDQLKRVFPFDSRTFQHFLKTLVMCEKTEKPLLLILAGEPTVKITGTGLGGRNQELALRMSLALYENKDTIKDICFLSAGTDGIDGPTPAAGAIGSSLVIEEYLKAGETIEKVKTFLEDNDSYNFYHSLNAGEFHVSIGHTGTNVMDLQLILVT